MYPSLHVDPTDAAPIWRQIEERVRRLVAAKSLAPGAPVPSVRELARSLRVNPATVAKAYQRLTDAGVLKVLRGEGTFVADHPPALPDGERERVLADGAGRYASMAMSVGATLPQAAGQLAQAWATLASPLPEVET